MNTIVMNKCYNIQNNKDDYHRNYTTTCTNHLVQTISRKLHTSVLVIISHAIIAC